MRDRRERLALALDKNARRTWGVRSANAITGFFNALALPVPGPHEYHKTFGKGYMVFLDNYGLIIRITHDGRHPHIRHPNILQPLLSRTEGRMRMTLVPGVHILPSDDAGLALAKDLKRKLYRDGINFWDHGAKNVGLLPAPAGGPGRTPIIIDDDAFRLLRKSVQTVERKITMTGTAQVKLYGGLRRSLRQAWPELAAQPDPEKMKSFWAAARTYCAEGRLVAGWLDETNRRRQRFYHLGSGARYQRHVA